MTKEEAQKIAELIEAAKPFLSADVVDETSGTIPLTQKLAAAIDAAEELLE
jgi:hypothetical protein